MKHSVIVKFLAIFLATLSLVTAVAGTVGIVAMEDAGLYVKGLEELQDQELDNRASTLANSYATIYAVDEYGNLNYTLRNDLYSDPKHRSDAEYWCIQLAQGDEVLVAPADTSGYSESRTYTVTPHYPIVSRNRPSGIYGDASSETTSPHPTAGSPRSSSSGIFSDVKVPVDYLYYDTYSRWEDGGFVTLYLYYYEAPEYTVTVYLQPEVLESSSLHILTGMYPYRYWFIAVLAMGLILFSVCAVYLCWSAGAAVDGTVRPGGLNKVPLDIYAAVGAAAVIGLVYLFRKMADWIENEGPHPGNLSLIAVNLMAIILVCQGFLFAFCAQIKVPKAYWWHHSAVGWCLGKLYRGIRFLCGAVAKVFGMIPVIWQWLLTAVLMVVAAILSLVIAVISANNSAGLLAVFGVLQFPVVLLSCVSVVLYGGYAFGMLLVGARKMAQGDLNHKISTRYLFGSFRECAEQLNSLSDTAMKEARNRLRSERMKTELITNVSHDIKTPLTSIINFVDLLQKPHTEAEGKQYLEVLSRQSGRMKKLIEDLMDLSKANTGNLAVSLIRLDLAEAVQQALGEFADKLDSACLAPVFRHPEESVWVWADGRLTWRVLSNLLSNAVKYAMPGTRLYLELSVREGQVLLSMKNISREELSTSAEELMERFVQGDVSRNAEGSGLGLNIAQSLMEVQHGSMAVSVDGDLFKVTLTFRAEA